MSGKPIHPRLAGAEPPAPPQRVRAAVLAAAERNWDAPRPDVWTRLWESRPVRLAWAAAVLALVTGHLLVSARSARPDEAARAAADDRSMTLARPGPPEVEAIAGRMRIRTTPATWMGEGRSRDSGDPLRATPQPTKEIS